MRGPAPGGPPAAGGGGGAALAVPAYGPWGKKATDLLGRLVTAAEHNWTQPAPAVFNNAGAVSVPKALKAVEAACRGLGVDTIDSVCEKLGVKPGKRCPAGMHRVRV